MFPGIFFSTCNIGFSRQRVRANLYVLHDNIYKDMIDVIVGCIHTRTVKDVSTNFIPCTFFDDVSQFLESKIHKILKSSKDKKVSSNRTKRIKMLSPTPSHPEIQHCFTSVSLLLHTSYWLKYGSVCFTWNNFSIGIMHLKQLLTKVNLFFQFLCFLRSAFGDITHVKLLHSFNIFH